MTRFADATIRDENLPVLSLRLHQREGGPITHWPIRATFLSAGELPVMHGHVYRNETDEGDERQCVRSRMSQRRRRGENRFNDSLVHWLSPWSRVFIGKSSEQFRKPVRLVVRF